MLDGLKKKAPRYPRALTDAERALRIDPKNAMGAEPRDYCKVVRVNSTFLEIVGADYAGRGLDIGVGMPLVALLLAFILMALYFAPQVLLESVLKIR